MIPNTFDLRQFLLPIKKETKIAQCLPVVLCTIKEFYEHKNSAFWEYFSSDFIYHYRNKENDSGMNLNDAINISTTIGMLPEKYWNKDSITQETLDTASKYKFNTYQFINSIDELKYSLFDNGPCYISLPMYNEHSYTFWIKEYPNEDKQCNHAMTVVGWTDDAFILRNSWGPKWGYSGYTFLQFNNWDLVTKCLTIK
jgi:C1A family cysteine protease